MDHHVLASLSEGLARSPQSPPLMPLILTSRRLIPRTAGSTPVGLPGGRVGRVTGASPLLGSDKEAILELIISRSNRQRQEICQNYKSLYGKVTMTTRGLGAEEACSDSSRPFPEYFTPAQLLCWHFCPPFFFSQSGRDHSTIIASSAPAGHCARG